MILTEEFRIYPQTEDNQPSINGLADAHEAVFSGFSIGIKPPPPVDFTEWAKENIIFGQESPFPGKYNPDLFPFFKKILSHLEPDHPAREVVLKKSAQLGGTIVAQVFVGGSLDLDPSPVLYIHPTIDNGGRWSKTKWKPFVQGSEALRKIFPSEKSRDTSNSTLYKERADGRGHLLISGANSSASLSMVSYPKQVQDDLAKWQNNDAGDPESQADSRSEAFEWAKIFKVSTPMLAGTCKISKNFERSDQQHFHVPCPHCGHEHPLEWENFRKSLTDDLEDYSDACFFCPECGGVIEHHHKQEMVSKGKWVAHNPKSKISGFYIWSAYSPLTTWARIAQKWFKAKGDPEAEQNFYNDSLGLPYEQKGESPPWEELRDRAKGSDYSAGQMPADVVLLTLGIDVQGDRVEWLLKGWGTELRRYSIQYGVIEGHITEKRVQASLDALIKRQWRNFFGRDIGVDMTAIDANYETNDVKDWAKKHQKVITVKGSRNYTAPPMLPIIEERDNKGKIQKKRQTKHWMVGVSGLKGSLYKNLEKTDPLERGYCGFPNDFDEEYFKQLASERRMLEVNKRTRHNEYRWVKLPNVRNEILDMENYAEVAARRLGWHNASESDWERVKAERCRPPDDVQLDLLDPSITAQAVKPPPPQSMQKNGRRVRSKGI